MSPLPVDMLEEIAGTREARYRTLLAHNEQLSLVIEGARLGFWDWNPQTGEWLFNARLAEMIGFRVDELPPTRQSWEQRIHPDDVDSYRRALAAHVERQTSDYEHVHRLCHSDGRWIHVLDRGRIFARDADGKPVRFCGTYTDITAERNAQRKALDASRAKTHFLANMSHELRTPLNAVMGLSEALLERTFGELNERQARSLQTIHDSGRHLLALINDVLDIARVESGKLPIEMHPTAVLSLFEETVALMSTQVSAKLQRLVVKTTPELPTVDVDRRRVKQVLLNLLANAVKFSPAGATITLRAQRVELAPLVDSAAPRRSAVEIEVSDNGPGIPEADHERVFEPFVTLDVSLTRDHQMGAGLGLALVKRIVELHGGSVRVKSQVGVGTTFIVTLPTSSSPATAPLPRTRTPATRHSKGKAPVVLLAEDNEANVITVQSYLESVGYTVRVVRNGAAAVVEAAASDIAVVLMDVQLPVLDGLEAIRRIRTTASGRQMPIIALTAYAMPGDRERCLAAGASAYLAKPVRLHQLTETIEGLTNGGAS